MKHVTYAEKSLLVGDATADLLMQYAAALSSAGDAEAVEVHAISSDGNDVIATFLIGAGAPLSVETSTTALPEPDNDALDERLEDTMHRWSTPTAIEPHHEDDTIDLGSYPTS